VLIGAAHSGCESDRDNTRSLTILDSALIQHFESQLQRDILAVEAAVTDRWSNGPVEGQVNRLKTIKRHMYGRAGVELLRDRTHSAFRRTHPLATGLALTHSRCNRRPAICAILLQTKVFSSRPPPLFRAGSPLETTGP
jgi:hypothetical protein